MKTTTELERLFELLSAGEWPDHLVLLQLADQLDVWARESDDPRAFLVAESTSALRDATKARDNRNVYVMRLSVARVLLSIAVGA